MVSLISYLIYGKLRERVHQCGYCLEDDSVSRLTQTFQLCYVLLKNTVRSRPISFPNYGVRSGNEIRCQARAGSPAAYLMHVLCGETPSRGKGIAEI